MGANWLSSGVGSEPPHRRPCRHRWREVACTAVLTAVALAGAACSAGSGQPRAPISGPGDGVVGYPPRVALFGDSLSFEAEPYYVALVHATGETALTYDSFGGTAICDFLPRMRQVAAKYHPDTVQLEFSGNALTPCMKGYVPGSAPYYGKYGADTEAAIRIFVRAGAHVFLVGTPITRSQQASDPNWDALNRQYAAIASADPGHVTYVDAGAAVEGPGHTYVQTMACLPVEPCIGPVVDGVPSNTVRAPDGEHFCPVKSGNKRGVIGRCTVYSSGAFRFANAMVAAIATPRGLPAAP